MPCGRMLSPLLAPCLVVVCLGGVHGGRGNLFGDGEGASKAALGRVGEFESAITLEESKGAGPTDATQGVTMDPLATGTPQSEDSSATDSSHDINRSTTRFQVEAFPITGPMKWECLTKRMQDLYTLDGKIPLSEFYLDEGWGGSGTNVGPTWSNEHIDRMVAVADARNASGPLSTAYGSEAHRGVFEAFKDHPVEGKSVLVIGSQVPWVEAILISFGAAPITTVDFNPPVCSHPKLKMISVADLEASNETYDALVSFSSIEHDGLGRYGDPLNPNGDLLRMQKMKGLIKKDGKLYLGVPAGIDSLAFNAHRVYGPIRYPMLTSGWEVKGTYGFCKLEDCFLVSTDGTTQPLAVLTLKE